MTKTKIILGVFLSIIFTSNIAGAQNVTQLPTSASTCVNLSNNMRIGSRDSYTNGEVSSLQSYLNTSGYLSVSATGYFGPLTLKAVQRFQSENGLFSAGYVGPMTRARITELSCVRLTSAPIVYSISPTSGPVGTMVTINGANFTPNVNVQFSSGYAPINFISSNKITFNVPSSLSPRCYYSTPPCMMLMASKMVTLGDYSINVDNGNDTSNSVIFTVTSGTQTNNPPVINGLDTPTNLSVDQSGTWIVRATDVTGGGLSYSVVWGDEVYAMTAANTTSTTYNQTSTFTHAYHSSGTFTPVFTVRGSNGQSVQTSASVIVNATNTQIPHINSAYPTSGAIGSTVTLIGYGFTSSNNTIVLKSGSRAIYGISSSNGTSLSFVLPQYTSAYCPAAPGFNVMCPQYAEQLTPGTYSMSVANSNGSSDEVSFTVVAS